MSEQPTTVAEIQRLVRESTRVCAHGGRTKLAVREDAVLMDLRALSGIVEYAPEECVFTARAGTRLQDIEAALAGHGQYLPFDPPFADDGATLGGTVAAGISGARRYRYGGVRDFLIGVRLVDGEGRLIRSGGKVVKNAAGFLLHHGVVGSSGRFGVLTEMTFKVFPQPDARRIVTIDCGSVDGAFELAREVEGLRCDCESIDFDHHGTLQIGLAGRRSAIEARAARLLARLGSSRHSRPMATTASALVNDSAADRFPVDDSSPDPTRSSCVKVAGLLSHWQQLRVHVTAARFMSAGAVAWLYTDDLDELDRALRGARLAGLVIRGPRAGGRIGHRPHDEFEERVRRVLDPQDKFSAAPDCRR